MMLGFTSAMGFSYLETLGYDFNAFMSNVGQHDAATLAHVLANHWGVLGLDASIVSRSLVNLVGHGTWTVLTCYVLLHEYRRAGRLVLNRRVVGAFALAVLLHAAWDTSLLITPPNTYEYIAIRAAFFVTLIFNVWLLVRIVHKVRVRKVRHRTRGSLAPREARSRPDDRVDYFTRRPCSSRSWVWATSIISDLVRSPSSSASHERFPRSALGSAATVYPLFTSP